MAWSSALQREWGLSGNEISVRSRVSAARVPAVPGRGRVLRAARAAAPSLSREWVAGARDICVQGQGPQVQVTLEASSITCTPRSASHPAGLCDPEQATRFSGPLSCVCAMGPRWWGVGDEWGEPVLLEPPGSPPRSPGGFPANSGRFGRPDAGARIPPPSPQAQANSQVLRSVCVPRPSAA